MHTEQKVWEHSVSMGVWYKSLHTWHRSADSTADNPGIGVWSQSVESGTWSIMVGGLANEVLGGFRSGQWSWKAKKRNNFSNLSQSITFLHDCLASCTDGTAHPTHLAHPIGGGYATRSRKSNIVAAYWVAFVRIAYPRITRVGYCDCCVFAQRLLVPATFGAGCRAALDAKRLPVAGGYR